MLAYWLQNLCPAHYFLFTSDPLVEVVCVTGCICIRNNCSLSVGTYSCNGWQFFPFLVSSSGIPHKPESTPGDAVYVGILGIKCCNTHLLALCLHRLDCKSKAQCARREGGIPFDAWLYRAPSNSPPGRQAAWTLCRVEQYDIHVLRLCKSMRCAKATPTGADDNHPLSVALRCLVNHSTASAEGCEAPAGHRFDISEYMGSLGLHGHAGLVRRLSVLIADRSYL